MVDELSRSDLTRARVNQRSATLPLAMSRESVVQYAEEVFDHPMCFALPGARGMVTGIKTTFPETNVPDPLPPAPKVTIEDIQNLVRIIGGVLVGARDLATDAQVTARDLRQVFPEKQQTDQIKDVLRSLDGFASGFIKDVKELQELQTRVVVITTDAAHDDIVSELDLLEEQISDTTGDLGDVISQAGKLLEKATQQQQFPSVLPPIVTVKFNVDELIRNLGDDDVTVRDSATAELTGALRMSRSGSEERTRLRAKLEEASRSNDREVQVRADAILNHALENLEAGVGRVTLAGAATGAQAVVTPQEFLQIERTAVDRELKLMLPYAESVRPFLSEREQTTLDRYFAGGGLKLDLEQIFAIAEFIGDANTVTSLLRTGEPLQRLIPSVPFVSGLDFPAALNADELSEQVRQVEVVLKRVQDRVRNNLRVVNEAFSGDLTLKLNKIAQDPGVGFLRNLGSVGVRLLMDALERALDDLEKQDPTDAPEKFLRSLNLIDDAINTAKSEPTGTLDTKDQNRLERIDGRVKSLDEAKTLASQNADLDVVIRSEQMDLAFIRVAGVEGGVKEQIKFLPGQAKIVEEPTPVPPKAPLPEEQFPVELTSVVVVPIEPVGDRGPAGDFKRIREALRSWEQALRRGDDVEAKRRENFMRRRFNRIRGGITILREKGKDADVADDLKDDLNKTENRLQTLQESVEDLNRLLKLGEEKGKVTSQQIRNAQTRVRRSQAALKRELEAEEKKFRALEKELPKPEPKPKPRKIEVEVEVDVTLIARRNVILDDLARDRDRLRELAVVIRDLRLEEQEPVQITFSQQLEKMAEVIQQSIAELKKLVGAELAEKLKQPLPTTGEFSVEAVPLFIKTAEDRIRKHNDEQPEEEEVEVIEEEVIEEEITPPSEEPEVSVLEEAVTISQRGRARLAAAVRPSPVAPPPVPRPTP